MFFFCGSMILSCWMLLDMLVTKREPTPGYNDAHLVGTSNWAFWKNSGQKHRKTTISPLVRRLFLVSKRTVYFFGCWWYGCSKSGGLGTLVLVKKYFTPCELSVEFANVGGWLTYGDLALDSCAQFLAVAEHRLSPSGSRSFCHQLRKAGYQSVCLQSDFCEASFSRLGSCACPQALPSNTQGFDLLSLLASWGLPAILEHFKTAIWKAWQAKAAGTLSTRKGFLGGPFFDWEGTKQLLFSFYLREWDKMLLRCILCGGAWNGFLLGKTQRRRSSVPPFWRVGGDGHLLRDCQFPPVVRIRENPEFSSLMACDLKIGPDEWPCMVGCLLSLLAGSISLGQLRCLIV